jgi:Flp pilus assembly protein TadG
MQRLKAFLKSERGNVLAMGAAAIPLLLGSAGYAVDTFQIAVMNRQMQRAADSAAIAGAYAMSQGSGATEEQTYASGAATREIDRKLNKTPALVGTPVIVTGASLGFNRTVRVNLTATPRLPFMAIFTKSTTKITATATAALVDNGRFCMLSLYDGTAPGISVGGGADLNLGCGMASNSTGPNGIEAFGNSTVNASPIMARGGLTSSSNYAAGTKLQPYGAEQKDPYAFIPDPVSPGGCPAKQVNADETLEPGCYSSLEFKKGTATLKPGTYLIDGGKLDFGAQGKAVGTGVTFVMTGPGGAAGDFEMNAQAEMNVSAPSSGTYKGILIYRDRRAAPTDIKINGGSDATMTGALYFPSADMTFNGNTGFTAECFQLIGRILTFRGGAEINNDPARCAALGGDADFQLQFVRLVK